MAIAKTSELDAASDLVGTEAIAVVQDGESKRTTLEAVRDFVGKRSRIQPKFVDVDEYTLSADDEGFRLVFRSNDDIEITLPEGLPVGFAVDAIFIGSGKGIITTSGDAGYLKLDSATEGEVAVGGCASFWYFDEEMKYWYVAGSLE